jgi:hypothetical protein
MFAVRRRRYEVEIGQRWRASSTACYHWEVMRIYEDREGISHVALQQIEDPTIWRTIATEVLLSGSGYEPVSSA